MSHHSVLQLMIAVANRIFAKLELRIVLLIKQA
jgi:hypothetical protein